MTTIHVPFKSSRSQSPHNIKTVNLYINETRVTVFWQPTFNTLNIFNKYILFAMRRATVDLQEHRSIDNVYHYDSCQFDSCPSEQLIVSGRSMAFTGQFTLLKSIKLTPTIYCRIQNILLTTWNFNTSFFLFLFLS